MSRSRSACLVLFVFSLLPISSTCLERGTPQLKDAHGQNIAEGQHSLGTRRTGIIEDFATRQCWSLERDGNHPSWPAKLVRISDDLSCQCLSPPSLRSNSKTAMSSRPAAMIREGDVVSVTEETSALQSEFEGIALSSGLRGDVIGVRLQFARKIIRARVVGPGRAKLATDPSEVR